MIRLFCVLISVYFLVGPSKIPDHPATSFIVADTILTQIYLKTDDQGIPDRYRARIFTPVCETERCYAIELDLQWNLIGDIIGYDTLPGKGLTKLDHIPFTKDDYQKLHEILLNDNSVLGAYKKDDLVESTRTSELDGITGATASEIKNTVINGAVYSCYTLWQIAYGPVVDSIQKSTMTLLSQDLVRKLVDLENVELNYFLINHFSTKEFIEFLPEILQTLELDQGYYVKNALEKMPSELFLEPEAQSFFTEYFEKMSYFSQVALLKRLLDKKIEEDLAKVLQRSLTERNSYRNELIQEVLRKN